MTASPIRVLIADARPLVRDILRAGLDAHASVRCAREAEDVAGTVAAASDPDIDVVLVDAALPAAGGLGVCEALRGEGSAVRIVILADRPERGSLLNAVEAGADGYIDRDCSLEELADAITRVAAGEAIIPPSMLGVLLRDLIQRRRDEDAAIERFSRLSKREKQIVALLVAGRSNAEIADELVLSIHTARTHMRNLMEKLEVHTRLEVAALATRFDLIERFTADDAEGMAG